MNPKLQNALFALMTEHGAAPVLSAVAHLLKQPTITPTQEHDRAIVTTFIELAQQRVQRLNIFPNSLVDSRADRF